MTNIIEDAILKLEVAKMRQKGVKEMCDVLKLKGKIAEKGYNQVQLAELIHMDRTTLNRKLKTGEDFSVKEAETIAKILELDGREAANIFFNAIVA